MKVGDLVMKIKGHVSLGKIGVITKVYNTKSKGSYPILEVLLEGEIEKWAGHLVEVVNERR